MRPFTTGIKHFIRSSFPIVLGCSPSDRFSRCSPVLFTNRSPQSTYVKRLAFVLAIACATHSQVRFNGSNFYEQPGRQAAIRA